jgi:hypothetical protein
MFEKLKENRLKSKYRKLYGVNVAYPEHKILDILIVYLEEVGISTYDIGDFNSKITFKDNTVFSFWDSNKWYAWMSSGTIHFSNGKILTWSSKCPSYEVLYKFKVEIDNFCVKSYNDYLPIKVSRKLKLNKLK